MRWIANLIGVILTLLGIWWILQGTGMVPIGFMAHQIQWAIIGSVAAIGGIALLVRANRRPSHRSQSTRM